MVHMIYFSYLKICRFLPKKVYLQSVLILHFKRHVLVLISHYSSFVKRFIYFQILVITKNIKRL